MTQTPDPTPEETPVEEIAFVPGLDDTAERPAIRIDDALPAAPAAPAVAPAGSGTGRRRGEKKSPLPGCLAVLVVLAVLVAGGWFAWGKISDAVDKIGGGSEDYSATSPGGEEVMFQVNKGDSLAQIGRNLKAAGIVKSVDAFIAAANANQESSGIQVGYYQLSTAMPAADALNVLVEPSNIVSTTVTIREGLRLTDIVATLAKKTGKKKSEFTAALADPASIGLPEYAKGNPEGYLFPATYAFGPTDSATDMVRAMVTRWKQAVGDNDVAEIARTLGTGYTPEEIMTVASLVQAEGRGKDMAKVARVIYNRLENPGSGGTVGRLEVDATVLYAMDRDGNSQLTTAEIQATDSPYNTYLNKGLPPGPIGSPGDEAIQAALRPADGDWYYYVTVNLATGETKFAQDYDEFLSYKAEYKNYCATQSDRC